MTASKRIRYIIEPISRMFGKLAQFVYPYAFSRKCLLLRYFIHTYWVASKFKEFGKGSLIFSNSTIIGANHITIGNGTTFNRFSVLTAWDKYGNQSLNPCVTVGDNCNFGEFLHLSCINEIRIGNGVLTGRWVSIVDNSHGRSCFKDMIKPPSLRDVFSKAGIIIEDNVWIGDKVTILAGVRIGRGAIIAANSVVNKDVPAMSIAAGSPAKIVKTITE